MPPGPGKFGFIGSMSAATRARVAAALSVVAVAVAPGLGLAGEPPAVLRALSAAVDGSTTVVTLALSRPTAVGLFGLVDPNRLVVDLADTRAETKGAPAAAGLVVGGRAGADVGDRLRLILDLSSPARIAQARFTGNGTRLEIALAAASAADVRAAAPIRLAGPTTAPAPATAEGAAKKADREPTRPATAVVPAAPVARPVVVIDPGHGGIDVGTSSPATGRPEKSVVLDVAWALARALERSGAYDVRMTRTSDVFVGLSQRVAFARAAHADLFVSIHADAEYDHSVRGATVYTLAEKASDERAAALEAKENASDLVAGHVAGDAEQQVGDILADLTLRETRRFSQLMARETLDELRRANRLVKGAAHRQAGLRVLRAPDVPSILVEIGFLSNKEDEALMASQEWRERTAHSLLAAIDRFFAARGLPGSATIGDDASAAAAASSP